MTVRRPDSGPYSLAARLALITAIWSALALLVTGVILTELFRADAEREFDIRIEADLVNLVRDAATRPAGEEALPVEPLGPLFREPFSGWAWQVRRGDGIVAQSGSLGPRIEGIMEPLMAPETGAATFTAQDFTAPGPPAALATGLVPRPRRAVQRLPPRAGRMAAEHRGGSERVGRDRRWSASTAWCS